MNRAEKFWNASASNYDRTEERFEGIHSKSRESAMKHLNDEDVVLDYGCGTGTTSCDIAHLVKAVQGIDISSGMIEIARKKAEAGGIENANFTHADIFDEAYKADSFDVILAFNVLHTVPDPERAVRRMHELLKPGGLIISVTPCFRDRMSFVVRMQILMVHILCTIGVIPIPIRRLNSADLDTLMSESGGLQVVDTEVIFQSVSSYFLVARKAGEA